MSPELGVFIAALFLLVCVLASKLSAKLGVPALVLFVGIGMLAGVEGPGGISFSNFEITKSVGLVLLALVLFAGGLDTEWSHVRPVLRPSLLLATVGAACSAGLIGLFANLFLGMPWLESLLLGSIISSTDAAAIFAVLRVRGLKLKHGIGSILEVESGTNDPVAVFLTAGLIDLILQPQMSPWLLVPRFLMQVVLGLGIGYAVGRGTVWLINRIRLEYDGLYMVITLAAVGVTYGASHLLHGSEFLAVYVAGITMASLKFVHKISLKQFHDGVAWLLQICLFFLLGLLVTPSHIVPGLQTGIFVALFLMLIARPISVFISLIGTPFSKRTKIFIAWAGLRGGFPIILGSFPILAGLRGGGQMFNVVFFVVILSVAIQGTSLRWMGKAFDLFETDGEDMLPAPESELLEVTIDAGSRAVGRQVVELGLPNTALIVLLKRRGESYVPRGSTVLQPGDTLLLATRREDQESLRSLISNELP